MGEPLELCLKFDILKLSLLRLTRLAGLLLLVRRLGYLQGGVKEKRYEEDDEERIREVKKMRNLTI